MNQIEANYYIFGLIAAACLLIACISLILLISDKITTKKEKEKNEHSTMD